ncbi:NYN domain-containing protein [Burkholderia oklahomensis]|uniref:NYN domain-containing protein n=1 Tax=Burkholderia oklahomensis TaxID=342113 RepID=UPI0005D7FD68|nr:NYN domain-containing protein [Burkholderia oklahomensis]AJX34577.1 NYN domain protein [Burkholderia oklahomensis C6786]MBI0363028.1 NYN domain-containing protein [Burkholderia oklahomensis]SUY27127.1 NYN domain [Burkholderia oklahomensis]
MALPQDSVNMALFCDFENIALGVRDTKFEKFDIKPVLEKLLLKGSIVVKKAYCDWDRYKTFKAAMHEASFELIEIPHVRQSGKNSADIRLVVDALDLCYTKAHVDTFVIISGDSDFSPLVSKLRENAKRVIGVGVKNSTSDLLVANCDEFIFYDDLAREQQRALAKRDARTAGTAGTGSKRAADDDKQRKHDGDARKAEAISLAVETFDALASERGESGKIWASVLKSAIKRRKPDFNESYYGFRAFGNLLDEAQARGLLEIGRDDKSGTFVFRSIQSMAVEAAKPVEAAAVEENHADAKPSSKKAHGKGRGAKKRVPEQMPLIVETAAGAESHGEAGADIADADFVETREARRARAADETREAHAVREAHDAHHAHAAREPARASETGEAQEAEATKPARSRARKTAAKKSKPRAADAAERQHTAAEAAPAGEAEAGEAEAGAAGEPAAEAAPAKASRKSPARTRRPRKTAAASDS